MPNNIDSKCKLCRRAGEKLFLKGDRCLSPKCAMVRRPYAPGVHGHNPSRGGSEFGKQLAMKQKIKRLYGVMERQFRHHFDEVRNTPGITGDQLVSRLERRLDNVVYRLGFAASRAQAKQLVSHKMFSVNGTRINIASYEVRVGDMIELKQNKKEKQFFKNQEEILKNKKDVPHWLELNVAKQSGKMISMPSPQDVGVRVDAQMVVEYYSK
ncbi:MAG: 30S ribosomal protein S4 [Candidatus Moranbacteria bacterium]|nr:30S ribosomal protein S4 [Candidatus Moranbacteria bacterium]MDD3965178.1 30S ribosomal protein S4 [Candidatus Moranbacteria bacterium]